MNFGPLEALLKFSRSRVDRSTPSSWHTGNARIAKSKGYEVIERLRQARENEEGFTLIELLVVIIIVGILAAIAIPVFLNQRNKGFDSAVRADLRNSATAQETWLTDNAGYTNNVGDLETVGFKYSAAKNYSGGVASLSATTAGNDYCMQGSSASGATFVYTNTGGLGQVGVNGVQACA